MEATGSKINANTVTSMPKLAETLFASSISDAWTVVTSAVVEKLTGTNKDADKTFISLILYPITYTSIITCELINVLPSLKEH